MASDNKIGYHIKGQLFDKGVTMLENAQTIDKGQSVHLTSGTAEGELEQEIDIKDSMTVKHK